MSFGKRGGANIATGAGSVTRARSLGTVGAAAPAVGDAAVGMPVLAKLVAGAVVAALLLALGLMGLSRVPVTGPRDASGQLLKLFAVLPSDGASGARYARCRLNQDAFIPHEDLRAVYELMGNIRPEETPNALSASAAFLSCAVRHASETCDGEVRDKLLADVLTLVARHSRTQQLVEGVTPTSATNGNAPMLDMLVRSSRSGFLDQLDASDVVIGGVVQTMVETGYVTPSQFGWFKPAPISRHLAGVNPTAVAKVCK